MRQNARTKGFTLIELLIVIAIIGILAAVLIPNLLSARRTAVDRAGQAFARNVYTAAQAFLAENVEETEVPTECSASGYTAGNYTVDPWGPITSCTVAEDGSGVAVEYTGGNAEEAVVGTDPR